MALQFDKHRQIVKPAPVGAARRGGGQFGPRRKAANEVLTIGLVNNMPDAALQATERQFTQLLTTAAPNSRIRFHCFSLPSIKRSEIARQIIDGHYADIADLDRLGIDGLIVTGAEPNAATLPEEPFWGELAAVIDWAEANTRSTIWSCLAAHAAVLHLDGIERHRLDAKCSGIFDCSRVADDRLLKNVTSPLKIAHSRLNALHSGDLTAHGYRVLTESPEAGVDIFARQRRSQFIFFQGHPEYDALSLQREYLRDITRYLSAQRDTYPAFPRNYFTAETEHRLKNFQKLARVERKLPLSAELPKLTLRPDIATGTAASAIFGNWLDYLSAGKRGAAAGTREP
jgi:homoserine O-succinyltransferase/O-acetyltransferase